MKKTYSFVQMILASAVASTLVIVVLVGAEKSFSVSPIFAQDSGSNDLILYANSAKDTDKWQSFIFYDKKTGDLWVYSDEKFKEHYKFVGVGQDLQKIK